MQECLFARTHTTAPGVPERHRGVGLLVRLSRKLRLQFRCRTDRSIAVGSDGGADEQAFYPKNR